MKNISKLGTRGNMDAMNTKVNNVTKKYFNRADTFKADRTTANNTLGSPHYFHEDQDLSDECLQNKKGDFQIERSCLSEINFFRRQKEPMLVGFRQPDFDQLADSRKIKK